MTLIEQMSYIRRPYSFHGEPPELDQCISAAEASGGLPLRAHGCDAMRTLAFECCPEGIITLARGEAQITLIGSPSIAPVLLHLLDHCLTEAGGIAAAQRLPGRRLAAPFSAHEVTAETARVQGAEGRLPLTLGFIALLATATGVASFWLLMRTAMHGAS